ncbi:TfoX/Sxy family protein [Geomonas sp. RF6]|uniref:TfoX/Sxy family protein n=1 Tax=Geomonas sp. RF6 TaxID=2897342 RepID=UPI001E301AB6|nr:TfoX/Sxy family protein [Geomonas sp. RF6]UFS71547.1 TfoX/Sxy family protein [Geomonas sp. RF6]
MPWKPSSPEIVSLLEAALCDLSCEKKKMFGCPVYFTNGALFAGVHEGRIFLRLSSSDRDAFLKDHPDAPPFEPMPGRRMREYLLVPAALADAPPQLTRWLTSSHRYAASLPPKTRPATSRRGRP